MLDTCKRLERMRQERIDELKMLRLSELTGERRQPRKTLPALEIKHDLDKDQQFQRWAVEGRRPAPASPTST